MSARRSDKNSIGAPVKGIYYHNGTLSQQAVGGFPETLAFESFRSPVLDEFDLHSVLAV